MIPRYTRQELVELWSDGHRYETWLRVELAACAEMEKAGTVPAGTTAAVRAKAAGKLDPARILEHEERTRHDVIAFLTHVEELAGEPARWLHLGMTSSDVLDASFAIQLVEAADRDPGGRRPVAGRLPPPRRGAPRDRRHRPLARHPRRADHGGAGVRGLVRGARAREGGARLARAQEIAVGKIAGAVGTYANLEPAVEQAALASLGLRREVVPTQVVARDRHAAFFLALARLGTAVERLAVTVRHWQRTEVGEATEAFGKGQKGSSAMPHKKNPILSENLCGIARLLRSYASAALEDVALWHERDISHSSVERVIGPDATGLADFMVRRAAGLVDGLVVNAARMRENLDQAKGLYFSEAVMLTLVRKGMARQAAYELVQRNALRAVAGEGKFRDLLAADKDITARIDAGEIDRAFNLEHHLRHAGAIIDRALAEESSS